MRESLVPNNSAQDDVERLSSASPKIQIEDVWKIFRKVDGSEVTAVAGVNLTIFEGEHVSFVGKTGCGKSTLLSIIIGLEAPTKGQVVIDGWRPYADFEAFRGRIGIVFQDYRLLPWKTVKENVRVSLRAAGVVPGQHMAIIQEWLTRVGLSHVENSYTHELSGGMQQRVAIARAFAINPEILLLDEAFGHLDEVTADALMTDFLGLLGGGKQRTVIAVTHNLREAVRLSDRIVVFSIPARVVHEFTVPQNASDHSLFIEQVREELGAVMEEDA